MNKQALLVVFLWSFACGDGGTPDDADDSLAEMAEALDAVAPDAEGDEGASEADYSLPEDFAEDSLLDELPDELPESSDAPDTAETADVTDATDMIDPSEMIDEEDAVEISCDGCTPGATVTCTTLCGTEGTQRCTSACEWGPCRAEEICNNCDDDADGHVDDGIARACDDAPACPPGLGRQACIAGAWTTCVCVD